MEVPAGDTVADLSPPQKKTRVGRDIPPDSPHSVPQFHGHLQSSSHSHRQKKMKLLGDECVTTIISGHGIVDQNEDYRMDSLSQTVCELGDPPVGMRDSLLVDEGEYPRHLWKGTLLTDMVDVLKFKYLVLDSMALISYETYKILEEDFTAILRSYGQTREVEQFVHSSSKFMFEAAHVQHWKTEDGEAWISSVPFSVFAEGLLLLRAFTPVTEKQRSKIGILILQGEALFHDVVEESISHLKEEIPKLEEVDNAVYEAIAFLRDSSNIARSVEEFVSCSRTRVHRNSSGHPFSVATPRVICESAKQLYNECLSHEFTQDFRHIAQLGKLKLDIIDKQRPATSTKGKTSADSLIRIADFLSDSDTENEEDEDLNSGLRFEEEF